MVQSVDSFWRKKMNYNIDKHDMKIVRDAVEYLHQSMKTRELFGLENDRWAYSKEDVYNLFKKLDETEVSSSVIGEIYDSSRPS